jgi:ParB family chromosome partitioning protein
LLVNRRSGLGKGLSSLIPTETEAGVAGTMIEVPISAIQANEYQPRSRFDEEALVSLTDSVRELGILQPVLVRQVGADRFELIAGERRWRAARRAGLPTVPAIVRDSDDRHSLEQALVENLHREDLNALEEASAYQQLIDEFALTQEQVAQRVGKSRSAVANTLRLFQLPGSVQRLVASGELGAGHARALLGCPDRSEQEHLADRIVSEGLNVRQVEELVRLLAEREAPAPPTPKTVGQTRPAALLELETLLGDHLATRVHASSATGKGRLTVEYADLDDLNRIFRAITGG